MAEEGSSFNNNLSSYSRYEFRPRWSVPLLLLAIHLLRPHTVLSLQKTEKADCATEFFGIPTPLPIFVSPCAKVGLGHPEGEVSIARGAGRAGIIQVVSYSALSEWGSRGSFDRCLCIAVEFGYKFPCGRVGSKTGWSDTLLPGLLIRYSSPRIIIWLTFNIRCLA